MEPVDETPSLLTVSTNGIYTSPPDPQTTHIANEIAFPNHPHTKQAAILDAMNTDHFEMPRPAPPPSTTTTKTTPAAAQPQANGNNTTTTGSPARKSLNGTFAKAATAATAAASIRNDDDDSDSDAAAQLCGPMSSINMHYEKSFRLLDANEEMDVHTADMFVQKLGCAADAKVKVVSIFGNTGDGKSHTMNHTLFGGQEIFRTSAAQDSCTMGVWAAHQADLGVLCLDTEGLLGETVANNLRTRLLLKVLAVSDVIVFRTRAERLHSDMFAFLGAASRAYSSHFSSALQAMGLPGPAQTLGPAVIVFHETRNTQVVEPSKFVFVTPLSLCCNHGVY